MDELRDSVRQFVGKGKVVSIEEGRLLRLARQAMDEATMLDYTFALLSCGFKENGVFGQRFDQLFREAEVFRAGMIEREKAAYTVAPVSGPVNPREIQGAVYQMSSWTKHECAWCGGPWQPPGFCEACKRDLESRASTDAMTLDERIAELKFFHEGNGRFLMVPFGVLHARVEQLMGRSVWTHEFANYDALIGELEGTQKWSGPLGSLIDIIGEDRADDVIVVVLP